MEKTEWRELERLRCTEGTWYRRRVYGKEARCCSCSEIKPTGRAFYEYSCNEPGVSDPELGWDGNTYCNRACMPADLLRRYNRASKMQRIPGYGVRGIELRDSCIERVDRLMARFEELGRFRGSITAISKEEGLSRQRVYQLLEKGYGRGQVPTKKRSAVAAS